MNLLSDLSSELAVAILLDKEYAEKVNSTDALDLIAKICEILEPISLQGDLQKVLPQIKEATITSH